MEPEPSSDAARPTEIVVPASHARAVPVAAGQRVEVVNTFGTQVVDTWAFERDDPSEYMSMAHTRSVNSRGWPQPGEAFVSTRRRPMLRLVEDTSPGPHDTLLCACNREIYAELGHVGYHRNCEDNLHEALNALGISVPLTPEPLNLFMNVVLAPDLSVLRASPTSRPGDFIALRAEMDLILVLSACPQDITIINSEDRTPRDVTVRMF